MSHDKERHETDEPQDVPAGLYHEAQADGVPYEDSNNDFTAKDLPKPPFGARP